MIELVIKIPEEIRKSIFDGVYCGIADKRVFDAIKNGISLPKGHGRLIDAGEYENSILKHYFDNSTVIRCTEIALNNAPTIIEADRAESEWEG